MNKLFIVLMLGGMVIPNLSGMEVTSDTCDSAGSIQTAESLLPLDSFPDEILIHIFSFIPAAESMQEIFAELANLALINKAFASLVNDEALIKELAKIYVQKSKELARKEFIAAAAAGNYKVVRALLMGGIAKCRNKAFISVALMQAISHNQPKIVTFLITHDVPVDLDLVDGLTPLIYAAQYNRSSIVSILLKYGADVHAKTKTSGETALLAAARFAHGSSKKVMKILLDNGADSNAADKYGRTAFIATAIFNKPKDACFLISRDINPNLQDNNGYTALMFAAEKRLEQFINDIWYLKDRSYINCTLRNNAGETAYILALNAYNREVAPEDQWGDSLVNKIKIREDRQNGRSGCLLS